MKRHLILLRHAAAKSDSHEGDHGRPLKRKGHAQARDVGQWLARQALPIDDLLLSTSLRTVQTAQDVSAGLGRELPPPRETRAMYLAEPAEILALIRQTDPDRHGLLVIGHNPGLSLLGEQLAQSGPVPSLPKGGLVVLQFSGDWSALTGGSGRLSVWRAPYEAVTGDW